MSTSQSAPASPIRVVIVEDDRATREGLGLLIDGTPGFRCIGTFRSVEEALRTGLREDPDVFLLDIHLPGMLGSEGVRLFRDKYTAAQILMLTVYGGQDRVFESICNGACGYLLKKTPPGRLLDAIREAHDGGAPMSPEIARKVINVFQASGPPERFDEQLTPQEHRVLTLLSAGNTYKEMATRLEVSVNTIRTHIRSVYEKLHVHSRSEAVSKALRNRLIN